ncbi:matrixin family metalloprotease [Adhaeretor mobilis]|uniref:Matrixin n=1 Tax=Adhaeretor mobilis TaxID=1930276 RepID=A0A517MZM8_9BACT|nr:matrixin family metalloprotease [Adhaeretor mobilis]QDT00325.1 Matrixin [Adhaeretor mobilis]
MPHLSVFLVCTVSSSSLWLASYAVAYVPDDPWSVTASGVASAPGTPVTLTWSIAPDGTNIPGEGGSNVVSYFDDLFNVTSSSDDLTDRPWFTLLEQSFERWSELGGIEFIYEPNDNGSQLQNSNGVLGTLGDVRLGGTFVDGASSTLAYATLPNSGDIVFDTGETSFYSNSSNNYLQLRNTLMHEIGHAIGLQHVESSNSALLLEPFISTAFDGPQLDDIRGIQGLYGDSLEKTNGGLGNNSANTATDLGTRAAGSSLSVGGDATGTQFVAATETDFVSITDADDADFFSFTLSSPSILGATLTPLGGVFNQGVEGGSQSSFDANSRNDLSLALFGPDGNTLLELADLSGAGQTELLSEIRLSTVGEYFVRVAGDTDAVQLYELDLSVVAATTSLAGDFDADGDVDGQDFLAWQRNSAFTVADLANWQDHFGLASLGSLASVPEPTAGNLFGLATLTLLLYRRPRECGVSKYQRDQD